METMFDSVSIYSIPDITMSMSSYSSSDQPPLLHKSGMYDRVARKKPLLIITQLNFLALMQSVILAQIQHGTTPKQYGPYCEAWWWQHPVMGMFLIVKDCGTYQGPHL
jgi:hypothetical protein